MERYVEAESYPFPYNGDLRPQNTAVLVIDMQMDFCGYGGWADTAGANMNVMRAPIEGHRKVLGAARENGFHVVYTREGHRADGSDLMEVKQFPPPSYRRRSRRQDRARTRSDPWRARLGNHPGTHARAR